MIPSSERHTPTVPDQSEQNTTPEIPKADPALLAEFTFAGAAGFPPDAQDPIAVEEELFGTEVTMYDKEGVPNEGWSISSLGESLDGIRTVYLMKQDEDGKVHSSHVVAEELYNMMTLGTETSDIPAALRAHNSKMRIAASVVGPTSTNQQSSQQPAETVPGPDAGTLNPDTTPEDPTPETEPAPTTRARKFGKFVLGVVKDFRENPIETIVRAKQAAAEKIKAATESSSDSTDLPKWIVDLKQKAIEKKEILDTTWTSKRSEITQAAAERYDSTKWKVLAGRTALRAAKITFRDTREALKNSEPNKT